VDPARQKTKLTRSANTTAPRPLDIRPEARNLMDSSSSLLHSSLELSDTTIYEPSKFITCSHYAAWRAVGARGGLPQTPDSKPQTPNPKLQTPNPKPQLLNPQPQAPHQELSDLHVSLDEAEAQLRAEQARLPLLGEMGSFLEPFCGIHRQTLTARNPKPRWVGFVQVWFVCSTCCSLDWTCMSRLIALRPSCEPISHLGVQGCLAHKKSPPPRTLQ